MEFQVCRYPEWRTLYDAIQPLVEAGQKEFNYEQLKTLAGIDIQSDRGRQQFYKFRRAALKDWNVFFEVEVGKGYVILPASMHPRAAVRRVSWARRKINMARAINAFAKADQLTAPQLLLQAQTGALLEDLSHAFHRTGRELAKAASQYAIAISDEDLKLLESEHQGKKKSA